MPKKLVLWLYFLTVSFLTLYSYVLVDPNLTLVNHPLWARFREAVVNFGYFQRELSSFFFIAFVLILFAFHFYFIKNFKNVNIFWLLIPLGFLAIFSYPFLSRDFFNYMFDARILTFYQKNPYFYKGLDFPTDPWLRFMHWTHRTYPYGPTFLPLTAIPSFLAFGKFVLSFLFFKTFFLIFFLLGVYFLAKFDKKYAVFFATNPLVIFEGLINAHNDLVALSFAIVGIYWLKKKDLLGRLFLLISGGIKYITIPLVILGRSEATTPESGKVDSGQARMTRVAFLGLTFVLIYLSFRLEVQPWYFLALFAFLPIYENLITKLNLFFAGLIFSYYPFVRFGEWTAKSLLLKHQIIAVFLIANLIYLAYIFLKRLKT